MELDDMLGGHDVIPPLSFTMKYERLRDDSRYSHRGRSKMHKRLAWSDIVTSMHRAKAHGQAGRVMLFFVQGGIQAQRPQFALRDVRNWAAVLQPGGHDIMHAMAVVARDHK